MESIIHFIEGDKPNSNSKCFFCKERALLTFGIIDNDKTIKSDNKDAFIFVGVGLCANHAEAFNSLLSGEHDINSLILTMNNMVNKKINLRAIR